MNDQHTTAPSSLELVPPPTAGRVALGPEAIVRLGDVAPTGRLRFDAIARILQDSSTDDSQAALVDGGADLVAARATAWIVRRMRIEVVQSIHYRQRFATATWCSGIGARWAERRTDVTVAGAPALRAAALWVNIDIATGRPAPLPEYFARVYGEAANGRSASQRLQLPSMPDTRTPLNELAQNELAQNELAQNELLVVRSSWPIRATDFDVLGHVNNAAYLHALESHEIAETAHTVDVEWRGGIDPGETVELVHTDIAQAQSRVVIIWLAVGDEVRATIRATVVRP